ncbi:MAG: hypothetical protein MK171_04220 [Pirellulales bacterium]|nr:hypothetical protein [Pirellulales bacterium]
MDNNYNVDYYQGGQAVPYITPEEWTSRADARQPLFISPYECFDGNL